MRIPRQPALKSLLAFTIASALLLLSACGQEGWASTLDPHGSHALRIYDLLVPIFWAALVVFVIVEGLLVYSVIRFRRRSEALPAQIHGNTRIEVLWTILPAVVLVVIAVLTFRTQAANSEPPQQGIQIKAIGHQWWWEFQYPDSGVVTANDLYIPVGQDVKIALTSNDVIHSFWVPKLAGKTDMIPTKTNYLTFKADQEGVYHGQCAEFCGEEHALMRLRVIAVAPETFARWLAEQQAVPAAPTGDAARGQQVFLDPKKACIGCHTIAGTAAKGVTGPNLTFFGSRETIGAGTVENTPENLAAWLRNPAALKPGNIMSTVIKPGTLSDQEIADLVVYLESMRTSIPKPEQR